MREMCSKGDGWLITYRWTDKIGYYVMDNRNQFIPLGEGWHKYVKGESYSRTKAM